MYGKKDIVVGHGVFFCFWTKGDFICILQKNDLQ